MADRTIVLAQNKRHAVRGVTVVNPQEFSAYQEDDDDLTYIVDMSSYLDGATISSVTRTPTGVTVSNTSNTTTRITQRLKGFGYVDFKVTASSGDVEEFRLTIQPRASRVSSQIAQVPTEMPLATTSTTDPTASDDTTRNFYPGSVWINTISQNIFDCITNAQGAAVWRARWRVLGASGAAASAGANTSENTLATITVPANAVGIGGTIRVSTWWTVTNSANNKTCRIRYSGVAGTIVTTFTATTQPNLKIEGAIQGAGTTSSQTATGFTFASAGNSAMAAQALTVDTTAATTVVITGQKASSGETLTLSAYTVELVPA